MRVNRIKINDFRGIEDLEVKFSESGVTIIEGRNEIGKTSLADALWLLLDYKDSSASKPVKAMRPIGKDVGPFVEAELTIGPYHLVYRKQWIKDRRTELEITRPQPVQLTGDEAHQRMVEILESETDFTLFRALRYQQGVAIDQAKLANAPSLLAALDTAAGGVGVSGPDAPDALFDLVEQERLKYFTGGGAIPVARKDKADELIDLAEKVAEIESRIRDLDEAAERRIRIEEEIKELASAAPDLSRQLAECKKGVEASKDLERQVQQAQNAVLKAETDASSARSANEARAKLKARVESAAESLSGIEKEIKSTAPALAIARAAIEEAETEATEAKTKLDRAEKMAAVKESFSEVFRLRLDRDQLKERLDQAREADNVVSEAQKFLAGCQVDSALMDKIDEAAVKLAVTTGRADAGHARMVIKVLKSTTLEIDGEPEDGTPGASIEKVVSQEVEATIGEVARITVTPPEGKGQAEAGLAAAEKELANLLSRAEVESQGEARVLLAERSRQEDALANAKQSRAGALRDLSDAQLGAKLERSQGRLKDLEIKHDTRALEDSSLETANAEAAEAASHLDEARQAAGEASTKVEAARGGFQSHSDRAIELRTRLTTATTESERSTDELEQIHNEASDDDLAAETNKVAANLAVAKSGLDEVENQLEAADLASTEAILVNAEAALNRQSKDLQAREIERAQVQATLDLGGHQGLSDLLGEARARHEDLNRKVKAENRRAAAVERLYEVLGRKREEAQRAFAGPFSDKVNSYARILFGTGVNVEIDHQKLAIVSRTLDGTTVPFDALSGGAREQLAVLTRLACGALVSSADGDGAPGGVPVIIDDALGYSDPERLKKLGAAFSVAGKDCQVIVLTCEPNRYREVGDATVVSLG